MPAAVSALPDLDIRGILGELAREGVDFLVIGGVAVGYHGHIRATKDVDVVPSPDAANLERLARVLRRLEKARMGQVNVMQWLGDDPLWDKLSPAAIQDQIGDIPVKFVSYEDLVALKELAGRPEDLTDLERLRDVRED